MSKREKEIRFMVSGEEYKTISEQAKKRNMQVGPYIRMVAQNPTIRQIDYAAVREHTREMGNVRNSINHLIFMIEATNKYFPKEIGTILTLMSALFESENELLKTIRKTNN